MSKRPLHGMAVPTVPALAEPMPRPPVPVNRATTQRQYLQLLRRFPENLKYVLGI